MPSCGPLRSATPCGLRGLRRAVSVHGYAWDAIVESGACPGRDARSARARAFDPRRGDISMAWSREFNQFKSILGVNTKVRGAAGAAGAQGLNMCKVLICDRIQLQDSYSE